jgi:ABC-type transport system involved in multi-copper enzyme maturation permease subunit
MLLDNPVLRKELLCGLRAPRAFIVLATYVALTCLLIFPIWPREGLLADEYQQRGTELFRFFTIGQFVVIALLAPAIASTAFAGEKERRVYDLIYTSPLKLPRVVMGKLLAAILFVLLLILSSLPAMSVVFQLGGVSGTQVVSAYVFLLVAAVSCGMIGLLISAYSDRSASALMVSYLIVLPLVVIISAVAYQTDFFFEEHAVPVLFFLSIWLAVLAFVAILSSLKKPYNPVGTSLDDERVEEQEFLQFNRERFPESWLAPARRDDLIEDTANPIYEKELRSEIFGRGTLFIRIIILLGLLVSIGFIIFIFTDRPHFFLYYLIAFAVLVSPAFSCGAFTLERERYTMDMLLATRISPGRFVLGKFLAVFRFTVILTALLVVPLLQWVLLGDSTGRISRVDILVALGSYFAIILSTIGLACAVAMAVSMTAASTVESMLKSYVALAGLFVGGYLVHRVVQTYRLPSEAVAAPGAGGLLVLLGLGLVCLVGQVVHRSARRQVWRGLGANLVALIPLTIASGILAVLLYAAGHPGGVAAPWENLLTVLSPFLAAVSATHALKGEAGGLPSPFFYVAFACTFAVAILVYIVMRWEQAMYVEGK